MTESTDNRGNTFKEEKHTERQVGVSRKNWSPNQFQTGFCMNRNIVLSFLLLLSPSSGKLTAGGLSGCGIPKNPRRVYQHSIIGNNSALCAAEVGVKQNLELTSQSYFRSRILNL